MRNPAPVLLALGLLACTPEAIPPRSDAFAVALRESVCFATPLDLETALELEAGAYALSPAGRTRFECVLGASDCTAVLACHGITDRGDCNADTHAASCEGDSVVECVRTAAGDRLRARDCARSLAGELTCVTGDSGAATCGLGSCSDTDPAVCDGTTALSVCVDGVDALVPCTRGSICRTIEGTPACTARGGTLCLQNTCESDVFVSCPTGVEVDVVIDCSLYVEGGTCGRDAADEITCIVEEPDCDAGTSECADSVARVCVAGRWQEVDCRAFDASCEGAGGSDIRCAR